MHLFIFPASRPLQNCRNGFYSDASLPDTQDIKVDANIKTAATSAAAGQQKCAVGQEMFLTLWNRQTCFKLPLVSKDFHNTGETIRLVVLDTVTLRSLVATEITQVTRGRVPDP